LLTPIYLAGVSSTVAVGRTRSIGTARLRRSLTNIAQRHGLHTQRTNRFSWQVLCVLIVFLEHRMYATVPLTWRQFYRHLHDAWAHVRPTRCLVSCQWYTQAQRTFEFNSAFFFSAQN